MSESLDAEMTQEREVSVELIGDSNNTMKSKSEAAKK